MKKLSIISLGWLGAEVYKKFSKKFLCSGSYNSSSKQIENEYFFDINKRDYPLEVDEADIIFFNIPPSKIENLKSLGLFFERIKSKRVILISSTSVYEQEGINTEATPIRAKGARAQKQFEIESLLQEYVKDFLIIRCGGLYGKERHPGYFLSGRKDISGGLDPINLVGIDDLISLFDKVLDSSSEKIINAVNTNHPRKSDYYKSFCIDQSLEVPSFKMELSSNKIIETQFKDYKIASQLP